MVPESNPLQRFFCEIVERNYDEVGVRQAEVQAYVANLLAEFCESENLFKIKNDDGRSLSDVGEMLVESDPVYGPARHSTANARYESISATTRCSSPACSRKHESPPVGRTGWKNSYDFIRRAKKAITSSPSSSTSNTPKWRLVRRMSKDFEQLVYGFNRVKNELQETAASHRAQNAAVADVRG